MRSLYQMLSQNQRAWGLLSFLALLASCAAYVLMPLLIVRMLADESEHRLLVALFVGTVFVYSLCQNRFASKLSQRLHIGTGRALVRIAHNLIRLDLATVERLGGNRISNLITNEVGVLAACSEVLGTIIQKLGVTILVGACVLFVSPMAAVVWGALVIICLRHSWTQSEHIRIHSRYLARFDTRQRDYADGLLKGLRQIQGSRRLRKGLQVAMIHHGRAAGTLEQRIGGRMLFMWQGYHTAYFVGLACFVYFFPAYALLGTEEMLSLVVLLTLTPINDVAQGVPQVLRAAVSARRLSALEKRLGRLPARNGKPESREVDPVTWKNGMVIRLKDVTFRYSNSSSEGIALGPINLSLRHGETLLIEGGNGSGKSTLLKVLTGLYPTQGGSVQIDGQSVGQHNLARYQALFSYVSADPFLFDRLYGSDAEGSDAAEEWLSRCRVPEQSVDIHEGKFLAHDLSLDLRKRVALVVAILEERPILVLDEIGGNQDASFCDFYYRTLLPELKAKGKTLVIVSHDQRFFDVADRKLRIAGGRLV